jgi:hypothetical protein
MNEISLSYRFTPAALISNFVPLLVIVDGCDQTPVHFEYKMWNVLSPLLPVDDEQNIRELQSLVTQMVQEYECEEHIYFYGREKRAARAMFHGLLNHANAVVAHHPDVQEFFDLIKTQKYESETIFYICFDEKTSEADQERLVHWCREEGIKIDLYHCVYEENQELQIQTSLKFLEKMVSQI